MHDFLEWEKNGWDETENLMRLKMVMNVVISDSTVRIGKLG